MAACGLLSNVVFAADKKPNILVIWGDDIGQSNISAYTKGLMGYRTPNIDRIANEGMIFTDLLWRTILHGWPFVLYHRSKRVSYGTQQGGAPRRRARDARKGSVYCRGAQAHGIRNRAIWQKSSRR